MGFGWVFFQRFSFFGSFGAFVCLAFVAARRVWKAADNRFVRCFAVWGSEHGLDTLPTLSAVGDGLEVGALRTATALRGFFMNDSLLGVGRGQCRRPGSTKALSTTPDPTGSPRFPQRSQRIRPLLAS